VRLVWGVCVVFGVFVVVGVCVGGVCSLFSSGVCSAVCVVWVVCRDFSTGVGEPCDAL